MHIIACVLFQYQLEIIENKYTASCHRKQSQICLDTLDYLRYYLPCK